MDELKSVPHARDLICEYFPVAAKRLADANLDDFARISYFLENPDQVIRELFKLEQALQLKFISVFDSKIPENKKFVPKASAGDYATNATLPLDPAYTKGLLTSYLNEWDARFGFNSQSNQTAETFPIDFAKENVTVESGKVTSSPRDFDSLRGKLPTGKAPSITGFAAPALFRLGLLRLGYHWKDPGAGEVHGDLTHRLQWFAITSAYQDLGVKVNPLYLFQKLGSPETWNPEFRTRYSLKAGGRALWDFICDCFVDPGQKDTEGIGPYSNPGSYRSPVSLQRDLTKVCENSSRLPLLRRILSRKKSAIRAKIDGISGRKSIAVIDYLGTDKTSEMVGQVAFFEKKPPV